MNKRSIQLLLVFVTMIVTACASNGVDPRIEDLDNRITELEERVEAVEEAQRVRSQPVPEPTICQQKKALGNELEALQSKRAAMSIRYTDKHPAVRDLDRQIRRISQQSVLLGTPTTPCGAVDPSEK